MVAYLPADKILLPGDTIEDSVVFISTPATVVEQIDNLAALRAWDIARIYPNHGNNEVIRKGGYDKGLIDATRVYLRNMIRRAKDDGFLQMPIETVIAEVGSKRLDQPVGTLPARARSQPQTPARSLQGQAAAGRAGLIASRRLHKGGLELQGYAVGAPLPPQPPLPPEGVDVVRRALNEIGAL